MEETVDESGNRGEIVGRGYASVHVDAHLIVIEKQHGLLSVPGIGEAKADCIARRVAEDFAGARIVHRLDRDTSGLMVLGLNASSHRALSMQFEARSVRKEYEALVGGHCAEEHGVIDLPIAKDPANPPRQRIDHEHGRPSVTAWRVVERLTSPTRTRVRLDPRTGRSHQLRLHMRTIGHPMLGDDLYAPDDLLRLAPRLCLHATLLEFTHPATHERLVFQSPAPF
ncbi:MAG: RluA family pseudouridine synthase [Phycisphaerae bacterium]|nr:RluA family pseudouridine synthase [Phycisphaerae bacterium]